jgi:hypothetical protein
LTCESIKLQALEILIETDFLNLSETKSLGVYRHNRGLQRLLDDGKILRHFVDSILKVKMNNRCVRRRLAEMFNLLQYRRTCSQIEDPASRM